MVNEQLLAYIREQIQQGATREEIEKKLLGGGWQEADVTAAMNTVQASPPIQGTGGVNTVMPRMASSHKTRTAILIVVALLLVVGISGYMYVYGFGGAERVFAEMQKKVVQVHSLSYSGSVEATIDPSSLPVPTETVPPSTVASSLTLSFEGSSDVADYNNPKSMFHLTANLGLVPGAINLESRFIEKKYYIRLTGVPDFGPAIDVRPFVNQWIEIDPVALQKQFQPIQPVPPPTPKQLTPAQMEGLKKAVEEAKIFTVTKTFPDATVNGVLTRHIAYNIDIREFIVFLGKLSVVMKGSPLTADEQKQLDALKSSDNTSALGMENPKGEIWIGKEDSLPYKVTLATTAKAPNQPRGTFTVEIEFKDYNAPVMIDIPSPVKQIQDVIAEMAARMQSPQLSPSMNASAIVGQHLVPRSETQKYYREDIISYRYPDETGRIQTDRIIGLPGETVAIKNGKVYINGYVLLTESHYLSPATVTSCLNGSECPPITLKANEYYVLGDNRATSFDSRHWGPLRKNLIIGKYETSSP